MDVSGHARLPGGGHRLGLRVRCRGEPSRRPHARPGPAAKPGPGCFHGRHPDRRRHHQRADVPREPLLPGPVHARAQPVASRPGDPARDGRTGGDRTVRATVRGTVRRPPGRRRGLRDHRPRLRAGGLRGRLVALCRIRPAADRRRRRDGTLERAGHVGVDGMRLGGPGRGGLRCLQHGPLRGRGRGHGARRDDLRKRHHRPRRTRASRRSTPCPPDSPRPPGPWPSSVSWASRWPWSWVVVLELPGAPSPTPGRLRALTRSPCRRRPPRPPWRPTAWPTAWRGSRSSRRVLSHSRDRRTGPFGTFGPLRFCQPRL